MDPTFDYGVALAKIGGRMVLRLADADVLPFEFAPLADTVGRYVDEVAKLADDLREETEERNRRLDERTFELVADPTQTWVVPKPQDAGAAPQLRAARRTRRRRWRRARGAATRRATRRPRRGGALTPDQRDALDRLLHDQPSAR